MRLQTFLAPLAAALLSTATAHAQDAARRALEAGREARAAGETVQAVEHLRYAVARLDDSAPALAELVAVCREGGDVDAARAWARELVRLSADARGRVTPRTLAAAEVGEEARILLLEETAARAEAAASLRDFVRATRASSRVGDPLLAEWAEDLLLVLGREQPAVLGADPPAPGVAPDRRRRRQVVRALLAVVERAAGRGRLDLQIRAARVLAGLAAQAADWDEEVSGPEPLDVTREARQAAAALARARERLAEKARVWSIAELEAMTEDEARAFTLQHASFVDPGVALSPNARYRIETECGHGTLLGAARTVELHHARLVNWYGTDPFLERQGIVRIVKESYGLEMEGAPFWWVGGFQGGDVTTVKFTYGTIPGLGRTLTHELTHRFDGALFPGMPSWLTEGRAVWTAASYGRMDDVAFVDDYVDFGTMNRVRGMGYGDVRKLEEILDGENEEYRDNYPVGYALWVFLRSWRGPEEGGRPLFAARLEPYVRACAKWRKDPSDLFVRWFADGEDGRPDGLEAFAEEFAAFLVGFDWREPADWTDRYRRSAPLGEGGELVMDEPTFSWLRARAEPWFGQEQARLAAEVLAEDGREEDAVAAYLWSLAVDEPSDAELAAFADLLRRRGSDDAAWALDHWPRYHSPRRRRLAERTSAPYLKRLRPMVRLVDVLAERAAAEAAAGRPRTALALAAEHDELAAWLGLAPLDLDLPAAVLADPAPDGALHPFVHPWRRLGASGWSEAGLVGHEDRRVPGLWGEDVNRDLHVGRKGPRGETGTQDRTAYWRDAVVFADAWQGPGRYTLRCRIEATTSFLSGGVVLGWTRRDRNVLLSFSMGDWKYAAGEADERAASDRLSWTLGGHWQRTADLRGGHAFGGEATGFDLELRVDGPTVELWMDGERLATHTEQDGRPIQGRIGFFTSQGAMRVVQPMVRREDRLAWGPAAAAWGAGLDPRLPGAAAWRDLVGRPVTGLPLGDSGAVLLWFGADPPDAAAEAAEARGERMRAAVRVVAAELAREEATQPLVVVVPEELPAAERDALAAVLTEAAPPGGATLVTHARGDAPGGSGWRVAGRPRPAVAFVDPAGLLRAVAPLRRAGAALPPQVRDEVRRTRDHRRPGLAGAAD